MTTLPATLSVIDPAFIKALENPAPVDETTKLVPVDVCHAVISELDGHREPVGPVVAAAQTKVLLGSYPREPHDPETFTAAMVQVLAEQPSGIGKVAIDRLTRRLKHYPTRADLVEVIAEVTQERAAMLARAKAHLAERKRREIEKRREEKIATEKQRLRETLGEAWGSWWSIPIMRRFAGGTPEQFAEGWKAAEDKDEFVERWGTEAKGEAAA